MDYTQTAQRLSRLAARRTRLPVRPEELLGAVWEVLWATDGNEKRALSAATRFARKLCTGTPRPDLRPRHEGTADRTIGSKGDHYELDSDQMVTSLPSPGALAVEIEVERRVYDEVLRPRDRFAKRFKLWKHLGLTTSDSFTGTRFTQRIQDRFRKAVLVS